MKTRTRRKERRRARRHIDGEDQQNGEAEEDGEDTGGDEAREPEGPLTTLP